MKNIQYNILTKFFAIVVVIGAFLIIVDFQFVSRNSGEAFYKEEFYETETFQESYVRLSHNAVEKHLDLIDEASIDKNRSGADAIISKDRLQSINDNLRRASSFLYVLSNTKTGELITNIPDEKWEKSINVNSAQDYIMGFKTVVQWDSSGVYFPINSTMEDQPFVYRHYNPSSQFNTTNVNVTDVVYRLRSGDWLYYTAVDFSLMDEDLFIGTDYFKFKNQKSILANYLPKVVISGLLLFLMFIYLSIVIGRKSQDHEPTLFFYDYVPLEIQSFIALATFIPFVEYMNSYYESYDAAEIRVQLILRAGLVIVTLLLEGLSIIRLVKTKYIYKNPLVFKLSWWVKQLFTLDFVSPIAKVKVMLIIIGYLFISAILFVAMSFELMFPIHLMLIAFYIMMHIFLVVYVLMQAKDISSLIVATQKRAEGQIDYPIYENEYRLGLIGFAKDLNALQSGLQVALEEAIKGEKLKTELITNVSHDLKNPLTSIVTYIDLLEKSLNSYEDNSISTEERLELRKKMDDYIDILNKKSYRLKTLIEDLVSASKASSGNLEVDLMNIDIHQLILQCLGEKEHLFNQADIEIVLSPTTAKPIWAYVDPNHMYRVFDNLLSNIIKYSLKQTRVFISIEEDIEQILIVFKNISNHPLDNSSKELSKRFVRGDASRSTEGSGLGLSIVESLLILQKGKQEIVIDGDLFKVMVFIPKGEAYQKDLEDMNFENNNDEFVDIEATEVDEVVKRQNNNPIKN